MGMVAPSAGEIFLETDGVRIDLTRKSTEEIVSLGIALVPEGRRLFPKLTVEENLLLGAYRAQARAAISRNLAFSFEAFPVLRERRRQLAGSMSGGEQQMLAVARALMSSPRILLVDEPSVGLAPILVSRVIAKIKELKEQYQLTVLMAEQNFNQATKIADRGYIIVHGRIEFEGRSTRELRENELVKKYYLGVWSPLSVAATTTAARIVALDAGPEAARSPAVVLRRELGVRSVRSTGASHQEPGHGERADECSQITHGPPPLPRRPSGDGARAGVERPAHGRRSLDAYSRMTQRAGSTFT